MFQKFVYIVFFSVQFCTLVEAQKSLEYSALKENLIQTHWSGGDSMYLLFTPDHYTWGCHSTALAQILYYHHLAPFGTTSYLTSKGYIVEENFDNYVFDWDKFIDALTVDTDQQSIEQVALYGYLIACIVQKDFGTGRYMKKMHKKQLQEHFNCKVNEYVRYKGLFLSNRKIEKIVRKEIDNRRPVYFHYTNFNGGGHSVVIDNYSVEGEYFMVHLNFGWGGDSDGWYNLFESIANPDDTKLRLFISINPNENSSKIQVSETNM